MLNDLKELIAIESVLSEKNTDAPFGDGCKKALDFFLSRAKSYGLKTGECGGYYGWAELGDEGPLMGILGHLDVVPAGKGWSYPPFALTNEDGYLYGRGVVDDKGPTVVALHVLKKLKEENAILKHRVRLIVGCNEENGSACIKRYVSKEELPAFAFVPDADFPVINSEKGIAHIVFELPLDSFFEKNIASLSAGVRPNVVPDLCSVTIKANAPLFTAIKSIADKEGADRLFFHPSIARTLIDDGYRLEDFSVHIFNDKIDLEARGVAGHAMAPEKGENAFWKMCSLLKAFTCAQESSLLQVCSEYLCTPLAAMRLGIAAEDEQSGALTMNCGVVALTEKKLRITTDLRLPISADFEKIQDKITAMLPEGTEKTVEHYSPNLFVDENSKLVQTLLDAYVEQTGGRPYCVRCGGGTYARELPCAVAFGPTFENTETNIHNIDERISVSQFEKLFDIYYAAVLKLDENL